MRIFAPTTVVYDSECRFCIRSLRVLKVLDVLNRIELVPSNDPGILQRFPELYQADFSSAMYAVREGIAYRGFDAFRAALLSSPILLLAGWSWYVPPIPFIGRRAYAWIAQRRKRFGCSIETL